MGTLGFLPRNMIERSDDDALFPEDDGSKADKNEKYDA